MGKIARARARGSTNAIAWKRIGHYGKHGQQLSWGYAYGWLCRSSPLRWTLLPLIAEAGAFHHEGHLGGATTITRAWLSSNLCPMEILWFHGVLNVNNFRCGQFVVKLILIPSHDTFLQLRLILCCLVILARRAIFVLENPQGSLMYRHHRFEYLANLVAYVLHLIWAEVFWFEINIGYQLQVIPASNNWCLRFIVSHSGWDYWVLARPSVW